MRYARQRPILFLDFDRTLFDTEQFIAWLGEDRLRTMMQLSLGEIPPPDYAQYLYHDVRTALSVLRARYRLVIVTYAKMVPLQRQKLRGSGIIPLVDDVIITTGGALGKTGKAEAISRYREAHGNFGWKHVFVDDEPDNLREVHLVHQDMLVIRMMRSKMMQVDAHDSEVVHDMHEIVRLLA